MLFLHFSIFANKGWLLEEALDKVSEHVLKKKQPSGSFLYFIYCYLLKYFGKLEGQSTYFDSVFFCRI